MKILYSLSQNHSLQTTVLNLMSTTFSIRILCKELIINLSIHCKPPENKWENLAGKQELVILVFSHGMFQTHSFPQSRSRDATGINKKTIKGRACREAGGSPQRFFVTATPLPVHFYHHLCLPTTSSSRKWCFSRLNFTRKEKKKKSHSFRWAMAELTLKHEQAQNNEMVQ